MESVITQLITGDFCWSMLLFQNFLKCCAKSFMQLRALIKATNSKTCITSLLHLKGWGVGSFNVAATILVLLFQY